MAPPAIKPGMEVIVDTRGQAESAGVEKLSKGSGYIPNACHLEWSELVDEDGLFVSQDILRARLESLGIKLASR